MARIAGINLSDQKPIWVALSALYGVGQKNVFTLLKEAEVDPQKKFGELSKEEMSRVTKALEGFKVEGDLRREVTENIKRLKETGSYRGSRHSYNLPVRGQRTKSNARTKRGKKMTIGALKKADQAKVEK